MFNVPTLNKSIRCRFPFRSKTSAQSLPIIDNDMTKFLPIITGRLGNSVTSIGIPSPQEQRHNQILTYYDKEIGEFGHICRRPFPL